MKSNVISPFDKITLEYFKNLLLKKRKEAELQMENLDRNISNLDELDDADFSSIAHHMGDVGSDTEEQQLNFQLKERTGKYIRQIDEALQRIEKGTYGICLATGKPIDKGRLEAVPHTRYSMAAKKSGLVND